MKRFDWPREFRRRFCAREDELKWLYCELYGSDNDAFSVFVDILFKAWSARTDELKASDRIREKDPSWYKKQDMTGMLLYVDAFNKTLDGVRKKLDYISDCGVSYLHLMPLLESPKGRSDGGYAVSDFRKVQPELGTMDDLKKLTSECHSRGISVCLDFVMNHTSEDHEWAKRARAGEKEFQDRYFFFDDMAIPSEYELTCPQVFPTTAPGNFTYCEEAKKVVMTTFYPYQWDLNYANPVVFNEMTDNMLNLINHGVDVIRLDAVPYIWKELGTSCRNLPQVHTLVRMMRIACEIVCPGALLLGEVVMEPSKVVPYFGTVDKPECHMLYNVTTMATIWHTVATRDVRLLEHQLSQVFALPRDYVFLNYLRCHDDIGWGLDYAFLSRFGLWEVPHKKFLNDYLTGKLPGSFARGELYNDDPRLGDARLCGTTASLSGIEAAREQGDKKALETAIRRDLMLHALMFTLRGLPVLYSGDEIAEENDYGYHEDPYKAEDSRYLHRGRMDWKKAANRSRKTSVEGRVFGGIRRLEELRAEYDAFDEEADTWLFDAGSRCVLGIGRYYAGEKLVALFNFGDKTVDAWLQDVEHYDDAISGESFDTETVPVPAGGFRWLIHRY